LHKSIQFMGELFRQRVASRLQEERVKRGMSQVEFAKLLDMSQSTYNRLENGENKVDLDQLFHISQRLELPLYDFLPDNLNFYNNNTNCQGGVMFGNIVNNHYTDDHASGEISLLREKLTHAEDKIRLLENQVSLLNQLLAQQNSV